MFLDKRISQCGLPCESAWVGLSTALNSRTVGRFLIRKLSQDAGDNVDYFFLLFQRVSLAHVFDNGIESGYIGRPKIQNHEHFAFGKLVRPELINQLLD